MPPRFSSSNVYNLAVLAHVDHGKTSYTDSLLAANAIISKGMAGKLRYLDSRPDEQERGITMESSAVSLSYRTMGAPAKEGDKPVIQDYVINLIDTPGHVDFSSQVSTASRLCDGALILVDAVEGVCSQTVTVLRQAWNDRLKTILVINKIDRLVTELKLDSVQTHNHLTQVVENVNAVIASFYSDDRLDDDLRWREQQDKQDGQQKQPENDNTPESKPKSKESLSSSSSPSPSPSPSPSQGNQEEYQEKDDEDLYFYPEKGDVIFASAIDGWAFRLDHFAKLHAKRLGISHENLLKVLWGDFYLDPKTKRVIGRNKLAGRNLKPLFVQFVLDNIWQVYQNVQLEPNPEKTNKIIESIGVKVRPSDLKAKDTHPLLVSIFSQWLPLASITFRAIVEKVPSPPTAQSTRIPKILDPSLTYSQPIPPPKNKLERDLYSANSASDAYIVAYVSKMFAIAESDLPKNQRKPLTAEEMRARGRAHREKLATEKDQDESNSTTTNIQDALATTGAVPLSNSEGDANNDNNNSTTSKDDDENNKKTKEEEENDDPEVLIGFSRLYSGTLRVGQKLACILPRYNTSLPPTHPDNQNQIKDVNVDHLYMIMGRELVEVKEVPAGNVFGIQGLEGKVLRNATLLAKDSLIKTDTPSTNLEAQEIINMAGIGMQSQPIVRVALEPREPSQLPKLVEGLRLLRQADPCVETLVQDTGEHVILTAGELHLQRCLKDLRERFAKIRIQVSQPIVPYRETAVQRPDMAPQKTKDAPRGTIVTSILDNSITLRIRAKPLPEEITNFLDVNHTTIKQVFHNSSVEPTTQDIPDEPSTEVGLNAEPSPSSANNANKKAKTSPRVFWQDFEKLIQETCSRDRDWQDLTSKIWSFGPRREGANILVDNLPGALRSLKRKLASRRGLSEESAENSRTQIPVESQKDDAASLSSSFEQLGLQAIMFDDSIESAFQMATQRGPMCAEPMVGMAFFVESIELNDQDPNIVEQVKSRFSQVSGSLISAGTEGFRNGLLDWSPRLLLAMYSCEIQATSEVLGKVYSVVSRRRGRIVSEEMKEGTTFFTIKTMLPVVESFKFPEEIRKQTSGIASPQLVFHGFEMLDEDPYWVPTTEEELEDLGEKADRENVALKYVDTVRKRKGLFVKKKIVEYAEKQQTMKR